MRAEEIEHDRHLFVDDDELRRRINPKIGRDRFRSVLRALEAKYPDFPKIHALFRGRYWPAVKAWLRWSSVAISGRGDCCAGASKFSGPSCPTVLSITFRLS